MAVLHQERCIKQHVPIVDRKQKYLLYPILTGRFIAESATKTTDLRDFNLKAYGHILFFKGIFDSKHSKSKYEHVQLIKISIFPAQLFFFCTALMYFRAEFVFYEVRHSHADIEVFTSL